MRLTTILPRCHYGNNRMTNSEERDLIVAAHRGEKWAFDALITAHSGLIARAANRYSSWRYPFEDLFQEGAIGLMMAVSEFDLTRPTRLSTYAAYWIRSEIINAIGLNCRGQRPSYYPVADFPRLASSDNPIADIAAEDERDVVRSAVARLDPSLAALIRDRYWSSESMIAIGRNRHRTRQRIYQQEQIALHRLRRMLYREIDAR